MRPTCDAIRTWTATIPREPVYCGQSVGLLSLTDLGGTLRHYCRADGHRASVVRMHGTDEATTFLDAEAAAYGMSRVLPHGYWFAIERVRSFRWRVQVNVVLHDGTERLWSSLTYQPKAAMRVGARWLGERTPHAHTYQPVGPDDARCWCGAEAPLTDLVPAIEEAV